MGGRDWLWWSCLLSSSVTARSWRLRAGVPVVEVAARFEVSRQSVHAWIRRYGDGGLGALADRPRRRIPARTRSAPI